MGVVKGPRSATSRAISIKAPLPAIKRSIACSSTDLTLLRRSPRSVSISCARTSIFRTPRSLALPLTVWIERNKSLIISEPPPALSRSIRRWDIFSRFSSTSEQKSLSNADCSEFRINTSSWSSYEAIEICGTRSSFFFEKTP